MKFEIYTNNNKIQEYLYSKIYKIIIDNYFIIYPNLLANKGNIDTKKAYNNWINTILNTEHYNILIAYNENDIIGFIAFMYDNKKLCLSEVQIKSFYQGEKYLKKMISKVIEYANNIYEFDIIYGTINKDNLRSQKIFTHIGMHNTINHRYEITRSNIMKWLNKE